MHISKWLYITFFVLCRESLGTDVVKSRKYDERIVGGYVTDIEFHPYQVYIDIECGRSIIGRRWILTAAHCKFANLTKAYVGSSIKGKGTPYRVRSAIQMPLYFKGIGGAYFDFTLLELNKPLVYGPTVRPIKIGREEDIVEGKYAITTGYGDIYYNKTGSQVLRGVTIPIMGFDKCNYGWSDTLLPYVICAGSVGKSVCFGDSGGPLVIDGKLLGVTSYTLGCGGANLPTIFGSVPKVRSWIHRTTGIE